MDIEKISKMKGEEEPKKDMKMSRIDCNGFESLNPGLIVESDLYGTPNIQLSHFVVSMEDYKL